MPVKAKLWKAHRCAFLNDMGMLRFIEKYVSFHFDHEENFRRKLAIKK
jgi:hypothetical protein